MMMISKFRVAVSLLACLLSLAPLLASQAQAEPYVAGQLGVTFPNDFSSVEGINSNAGFTLTDLKLKSSLEWGLKAGYFLPKSLNWLGVETEFFQTHPHFQQQNATVTPPGAPLGTFSFGGAHVRVSTWAFNLIARYPGAQFQPYAGVGLGINWATVDDTPANNVGKASDTAAGLNVLAGLRFLVTQNVGLFTEYKYNSASFSFGGTAPTTVDIKGHYSANHIVFGVSYHF
jgi:opacity protein-like surface antigen